MSILSIDKISTFAEKNGLSLSRIFTCTNTNNVYIEMIASKNTSSIIVHVTPNYQLDIPANINISRYVISPIEFTNNLDDDDDHKMNRRYTLNDINTEIIGDGYDFLNTKKTLDQTQKTFITSLKKQMMRLRYCVLGLPYTLSLRYNDYFSFIDPADTSNIVFYRTHNIPSSDTRRLYLVCTISTFFSKAPLLDSECGTIIDGIMNVIETNQHLHIRNIKKMLEEQTHYIHTRDMEKDSTQTEGLYIPIYSVATRVNRL